MIGFLNAFLKPFLIILTLPLNIMTLGLFTFVINGLVLLLAGSIMGPAFVVQGFWSAFWGALILSIVSWALNSFLGPGQKILLHLLGGRFRPREAGPSRPRPAAPARHSPGGPPPFPR